MTRLNAWYNGDIIGAFDNVNGRVEFRYSDDYAGLPLSLSMRPGEAWNVAAPARWLDGLLPGRSGVRGRWARQYGTSTDPIDLLGYVGEDVAGAVSLLPPGGQPDTTRRYVPISEQEIIESAVWSRVDAEDWQTGGSRLSLAGAQAKFALMQLEDGTWVRPSAAAPSTHIFKPEPEEFQGLARLEAAALDIADDLGIEAATGDAWSTEDVEVLVVRRFDRSLQDGLVTRIHAEDMCMALGRSSRRIYPSEGGPTAPDVAKLIGLFEQREAYRFVAQLAFNIAIGNADAHAKNYSVLIGRDSVRLAPIYDAVPTVAWPALTRELSMRVGGAKYVGSVQRSDWKKFAERSRLDAERVLHIVDQAFEQLPGSIEQRFAEYEISSEQRRLVLDHVARARRSFGKAPVQQPRYSSGSRNTPACAGESKTEDGLSTGKTGRPRMSRDDEAVM